MNRLFLLLLAANLIASLPQQTACADSANDESVLEFADNLCVQGDYYRAITEYKRFLFLAPKHPAASKAEYKIALCYFLGSKWDTAESMFRSIREQRPNDEIGDSALLMQAQTCYSEEDYHNANDLLRLFAASYPDSSYRDAAALMSGMCLLRIGETDEAKTVMKAIPKDSRQAAIAGSLENEIPGLMELPVKQPWLAGSLSAILPGAGQLYIERPGDALVSFLLNGALIFGAVVAFDRDEVVTGSLIAFVETGWYFGNIYNAASGAHKYNRDRKKEFFEDLEIEYGLNLFSMDGNHLCPSLGLKLPF